MTDVLAPTPCMRWVRLLQLREKGEPDSFLYSRQGALHRTSKSRWWDTSSPIMPGLSAPAATTSAIWQSSSRLLHEQLGGERPECDGSQDHDLFLQLIEQTGGAAHLPPCALLLAGHAGSTSGGTDAKPYVAATAKKALADHLSHTGHLP